MTLNFQKKSLLMSIVTYFFFLIIFMIFHQDINFPVTIINKKLKEEGYSTFNNWSQDYTIAEEIISLRTSSKKDFNELINKIGFNSKKLKIILFGDYAHQEFLPIYKKKLERALPVYKNTPAGFLLDKDNFFWPDNS